MNPSTMNPEGFTLILNPGGWFDTAGVLPDARRPRGMPEKKKGGRVEGAFFFSS
jgi:hypothetical protein